MNNFVIDTPDNFWQIRWLDKYMEGHKGFIAGGCFKNILSGEKVKDIDIFFESESDFQEAVDLFNDEKHQKEGWKFKYRNEKACAFQKEGEKVWVEFIESEFGKPEEILRSFDFTVAKMAYYKEPKYEEKEVVYPDCGVPIFVIKDIGVGFRKIEDATEVANLLVRSRAFKVNSKYLNRSYERLNVINEGVVPAVEGCVGYTNEEFERVNKENNDPESAKIGSFNKTVEEANNIRSRVLKYVDKIKQERAYNIDLCMTFERYIEIADKDAERAMAFLKEAYPFNEETEVFIRKRYNMSIGVDPEEN